MGNDESGLQIHFAGDAKPSLTVAHELPRAQHCLQAELQLFAFGLVHAKGTGNLRESQ